MPGGRGLGHGVRNGARYRANARACVRSGRPCRKCGGEIDLALTERAAKRYMPDGHTPNPEWMHPMGGTAGHIRSVAEMVRLGLGHLANEPSNLAPEHRRCNSADGNAIARSVRANDGRERTWSRDW